MKKAISLIVVVAAMLIGGCMTEGTQERFEQAGLDVQACQVRVMDAKIKISEYKARQRPKTAYTITFKDERNALTMMIVDRMVDMNIAMIESQQKTVNDIDSCDDILVAMVRADSLKTNGLMSIGKNAVGGTLALIGLKIFADGFGPDAYAGSSQGDTWNVDGSRVVNRSGNSAVDTSISASGTGLGEGNVFDDAQGGFQNRNIQDITDNDAPLSNSGEDIDSIAPELPIE